MRENESINIVCVFEFMSTHQLLYLFQHLLQVEHHQDPHVISGAAVSVNLNLRIDGRGRDVAYLKPTGCQRHHFVQRVVELKTTTAKKKKKEVPVFQSEMFFFDETKKDVTKSTLKSAICKIRS